MAQGKIRHQKITSSPHPPRHPREGGDPDTKTNKKIIFCSFLGSRFHGNDVRFDSWGCRRVIYPEYVALHFGGFYGQEET